MMQSLSAKGFGSYQGIALSDAENERAKINGFSRRWLFAAAKAEILCDFLRHA
jgi:hypothetical protein